MGKVLLKGETLDQKLLYHFIFPSTRIRLQHYAIKTSWDCFTHSVWEILNMTIAMGEVILNQNMFVIVMLSRTSASDDMGRIRAPTRARTYPDQ